MTPKEIEERIVRNAVHELLDHGFSLSVDKLSPLQGPPDEAPLVRVDRHGHRRARSGARRHGAPPGAGRGRRARGRSAMTLASIRARVEAARVCRVCKRGRAQCAAPTQYGQPIARKPHEWDPTESGETRETLLLLAVAEAAAALMERSDRAQEMLGVKGFAAEDPLRAALAALEAA